MPGDSNEYEQETFNENTDSTSPQGNELSQNATPEAAPFLEFGGRKFKDVPELGKSYDSLIRDYSKTKAEYAKHKDWVEFGSRLDSYPGLREELNAKIEEYHKRREAGQSKTTAKSATGVSDELAQRLDKMESTWHKMALREEIQDVKSRYSVDDATMDEVLKYSATHDGVDLETSYKVISHDKVSSQAQQRAESSVAKQLEAKRAANVGSSAVPRVAPAPKDESQMTREEKRELVKRKLFPEKYGD